jgi:DNA/RNA endonuclease G (NUC1)
MSSSTFSKTSAHDRHRKAESSAPEPDRQPNSIGLQADILALQRMAGNQAVNTVVNSLGGGAPMPLEVRSEMEQRFGENFSLVRLHTDARAEQSATDLDAQAYTFGNDIVFNEGRFTPETIDGKWLLAHELAHVVQQRRGGNSTHVAESQFAEQSATSSASALISTAGPVTVEGSAAVGIARLGQTESIPVTGPVSSTDIVELNATIRGEYIPAARVDVAYDILRAYRNYINARLAGIEAFVSDQRELQEEFPVISWLTTRFTPDLPTDNSAARLLFEADAHLKRAQYRTAVDILGQADNIVDQLVHTIAGYQERQELTTQGFIYGLQGMKAAGGVAVGVLTAGSGTLVAASVGAVYAAAQEGSEQAMKVHLGMLREIDWEGIFIDAIINVGIGTLTLGLSRFSRGKNFAKEFGEIGATQLRKIPDQEIRKFAANTFRQLFTKQTFKEMVIAKATSIVQIGLKSVYDVSRGRANGKGLAETLKERFRSLIFDESGNVAWQQIFFQTLGDAIGSATNRAATVPGGLTTPFSSSSSPSRNSRRPGLSSSTKGRLFGAAMIGLGEGAPPLRGTGAGLASISDTSGHSRLDSSKIQTGSAAPSTDSLTGSVSRPGGTEVSQPAESPGLSEAPKPSLSVAASEPTSLEPTSPTAPLTKDQKEPEPFHIERQYNEFTPEELETGTMDLATNTPEPLRSTGAMEIAPDDIPSTQTEDVLIKPTGAREVEPEIDVTKKSGLSIASTKKARQEMLKKRSTQPTFGEQSTEKAGTEYRKGIHYREYNAAEIGLGRLRVEYDQKAGRPIRVSFQLNKETLEGAQVTERSFKPDRTLESAQPSDSAFTNSGFDRAHLASREAFKGDADMERAVDQTYNVVPMAREFNQRGAWREAEIRANQFAEKYGSVNVEIEPIYDTDPNKLRRLSDGTPIPKAIRRRVTTLDGEILEDMTLFNR